MANDRAANLVKINRTDLSSKARNQNRFSAQRHLLNAITAQLQSGAIVHFLKVWADPSLKRKPPQQCGAKRVNGLNFQPTRGFNRAGKQGAGVAQLIGCQLLSDPKRAQL